MLTGKCKEDFEKWLNDNYHSMDELKWWIQNNEYIEVFQDLGMFSRLLFPMQYGVYVDFFDKHGIYCESVCMANGFQSEVWIRNEDGINLEYWEHLENAQRIKMSTKAIEKANDIYNEITQA